MNTQLSQLLVVDDDPVTCVRLKAYFEGEAYDVLTAADGEEMWRILKREPVSVVLLDVGLPGKDGLELARELRTHFEGMGIILVTGRDDEIDKIVGLESGADDYVTKPFNSRELLARVKNLIRRSRNQPSIAESKIYQFQKWQLISARRRLLDESGQQVELTRGEFELLLMLVRNPGVTISRERLMQAISHRAWDPTDRTIDVLVRRLREKIEPDPSTPEYITTVRGEGYVFTIEVT